VCCQQQHVSFEGMMMTAGPATHGAQLHIFILKERGMQMNGLLIKYSMEDGGKCKDVNVDVANEIIEKFSFSFMEFIST
jgi:hypothetical protein